MTLTTDLTPLSPCVKLCALDPAGQFCLGCKRTIAEITGWSRMSGVEKHQVLARIATLEGRG